MRELTHTELARVYGGALGGGTEHPASSGLHSGMPALDLGFPWQMLQSSRASVEHDPHTGLSAR